MELCAAQALLREQATVDPLTGLPNRRSILQTLDKEISRARRTGRCLFVAMADLDHFKNLNDVYGHLTGDEALREAARRMEEAIRPYDSVGRYGGEEFLFVFPDCDAAQALSICERVRERMHSAPWNLPGVSVSVTASFGIGDSGMGRSGREIIDFADAALYRAKAAGRNRVEVATRDEMHRMLETRESSRGGPRTRS
jgi:diguanylate cyclase (GGDEF)-like protein